MRPDNFDVQELIDDLQGTAKNISEALRAISGAEEMEESEITEEELAEIDSQIFLCETCGWWCETSEAHENPDGGGDLCDDCNEEEEE